MRHCYIKTCTRRQRELTDNITFHRLPKRPELLSKWLENIADEEFTVTEFKTICSRHFEDVCFDRTGQTTRLRANACPTLYLRQDETSVASDQPFFVCPPDPLLRSVEPEAEIAHYKRGVQLDHSYADPVDKDYKQLYLKSKMQLQAAMIKIKILNKKLRRQKFRHQKINKFLREVKKKSKAMEDPFEEDNSIEKHILPKKVVILV